MAVVYYLTGEGRDAMSKKDGESKLPLDYKRLLGLIELEGHVEVIRGRLRRFPDRLKELEDLKMVSSRPAGDLDDFTFTGRPVPLQPSLPDEDRQRLAKTTVVPGATLLRSGSFLADERIANLPVLDK